MNVTAVLQVTVSGSNKPYHLYLHGVLKSEDGEFDIKGFETNIDSIKSMSIDLIDDSTGRESSQEHIIFEEDAFDYHVRITGPNSEEKLSDISLMELDELKGACLKTIKALDDAYYDRWKSLDPER